MQKIITFGEILMRLMPTLNHRFCQTNELLKSYGGSEANVAALLARLGMEVFHISNLPNNPLGQDALGVMRSYGVNTEYLFFSNNGRMGQYFLEPGINPCSPVCTYDRAGSSFVQFDLDEQDYGWNSLFHLTEPSVFHFSGITPALSEKCRDACFEAVKWSKKNGIMVSCDVNYRSKLWGQEEASRVMKKLCKLADILFINEKEASLFGYKADGAELMDEATFIEMVEYLKNAGFSANVITTVARVPLGNGGLGAQAILWRNSDIYQSAVYPLVNVIDPCGAGDAYAAMVLYGILQGWKLRDIVSRGVAAAVLKHGCMGDVLLSSLSQIEAFAENGRISGVNR